MTADYTLTLQHMKGFKSIFVGPFFDNIFLVIVKLQDRYTSVVFETSKELSVIFMLKIIQADFSN